MTAVTASIEIDVPPDRVWDVIMNPRHFGDWVTIHRKLGSVDRGDLREGYKVEQTLCLHRANFRVKWSLARCDAPHHAIWEGKGPAGSRARIEDTLVALARGQRSRNALSRCSDRLASRSAAPATSTRPAIRPRKPPGLEYSLR